MIDNRKEIVSLIEQRKAEVNEAIRGGRIIEAMRRSVRWDDAVVEFNKSMADPKSRFQTGFIFLFNCGYRVVSPLNIGLCGLAAATSWLYNKVR